MLFDTHFHLDLFKHPQRIIESINQQKIYTIAVTNLPQIFLNTKKLCEGSTYVRPALGYHPELVFQYNNQFELFCELLNETRYIGEIGIDNQRKSIDDFTQQKILFEKIINICSDKSDKVLTVHSRRAEKDVISIIGDNFSGKVILHWYSGSIRDLETALSYGFYFSINSEMVKSSNGMKIIKCIPLDRLLLESDSPFIGVSKNSSTLTDMNIVIKGLSFLKSCPAEDMKSYLTGNFRKLLSIA
jgi:TatD DNase family protein